MDAGPARSALPGGPLVRNECRPSQFSTLARAGPHFEQSLHYPNSINNVSTPARIAREIEARLPPKLMADSNATTGGGSGILLQPTSVFRAIHPPAATANAWNPLDVPTSGKVCDIEGLC